MRVFMVEPVGGHRGMHYYDFELCKALLEANVDVTLFTCDETVDYPGPPSLSVMYPFRGIYGNTHKVLRGLNYLRGLLSILKTTLFTRPQIAHFHYFHFPAVDYFNFVLTKRMGVRIVLTVHDVIPFDARPGDYEWLRRIYRLADRIIVHAQNNRETIIEEFDLAPEIVSVVPMGPYLQFALEYGLSKTAARQRLKLSPTSSVVLFFGQIKKVKGLEHLIQAFSHLAEQLPSSHLVIAGPEWKDAFDPYRRLIEDLRLGHRVTTRIEYVPDAQVGHYFAACDVVALPYTEVYQSAVLYMAYSFARPVVASAVGGIVEIVQDGKTGLLVPPGDEERLSTALLSVLKNPERAVAMGTRGQQLVREQYSWSSIAQQIRDIYENTAR